MTNYNNIAKDMNIEDSKSENDVGKVIGSNPDVTTSPKESVHVTVAGSINLNVRKSPDRSGTVLGVVHPGDDLLVINDEHDWVEISTESGIVGYVAKEYLGPTWVG